MHYVEEPGDRNNAAILVRCDSGFVFIYTHRPSNDGYFIEVPRGGGEEGETGRECAVRELCEETGISILADDMKYLGTVRPNTGMMKSKAEVFLVDLGPVPVLSIVLGGEGTERMWIIGDDRIHDAVETGMIVDGFTLSALALYWSDSKVGL